MKRTFATSKYYLPQSGFERRAVQLPSGWWIAVRELNGVVNEQTRKEYKTEADALAALSKRELGLEE